MSDALPPYHGAHTGAEVDQGIDHANIAWLLISRLYDGTFDLVPDQDTVAVTGLGLNFVPIRGFLQVESPADGFILAGNIQLDSFSYDGFTVNLSGAPDVAGYKLHFLLLGPPPSGNSSSGDSNS